MTEQNAPDLTPPDLPQIDRKSPDLKAERIAELKRLFPDLFDGEGQLDKSAFEAFFDDAPAEAERFRFEWAGKQESKRLAFVESRATLVADKNKSQNFDTTQNVIIEGDNLEALKLLQATYFEQVKCIYIDPPYNTGNDFIYPDKCAEGTKPYWRKNGTIKDGVKLVDNPETAGRYHSNWLNKMQPRLILARQLLRDDGVIFISIDDHEVHHLRKLCDEIFGEENFVEQIIWKKKYGGGAKEKYLVSVHEYILMYAKNKPSLPEILVEFDQDKARRFYKFKDENFEKLGYFRTHPLEAVKSFDLRDKLRFPVKAPDGTEVWPKRQWRWSKERFEEGIKNGEVIFSKNKENNWVLSSKQYLNDEDGNQRKTKSQSLIDTIFTQEGTKETVEIFGDAKIFPFPKPVNISKHIIEVSGLKAQEIILDFFAGSGTTAHAVMQQNAEDNGNRKYILVQIPEYTDEKSEAFKAGYKTISDICIERVKRAGAKIQSENPDATLDTGFRVYKLTDSHFPENIYGHDKEKSFEDNKAAFDAYMAKVDVQKTLFDPDSQYDLITEISLKNGYGLFFTLEAQSKTFAHNTVHRLSGNNRATLLCLDATVAQETIDTLVADYTDGQLIIRQDGLSTAQKWTLQRAFRDNLRVV